MPFGVRRGLGTYPGHGVVGADALVVSSQRRALVTAPNARYRLLLTGLVALAIGIVEPYVEIAWKCRAGLETSEACVWGRSLFPLGRIVSPVVIAPLAFIVLLSLSWAWRQWRSGERN